MPRIQPFFIVAIFAPQTLEPLAFALQSRTAAAVAAFRYGSVPMPDEPSSVMVTTVQSRSQSSSANAGSTAQSNAKAKIDEITFIDNLLCHPASRRLPPIGARTARSALRARAG